MSIPDKIVPPLSAKKEAILIAAAELFSKKGYAAISMRVLAKEIGITPAALYHHYTDKEALYYAVLQYVFTDKAIAISTLLEKADTPELQLERLIHWLAELFSTDKVFARLLHRELLDGHEARIKLLTQEVIESPFREIEKLMRRLAPDQNARLSTTSIIALLLGHFELMPVLQHLPGTCERDDHHAMLVNHAKSLMLCRLTGKPGNTGAA